MTLERSIKAIGHKEKAAFVFSRFRFSEEKSFSPYFKLKFVNPDKRLLAFGNFGFKHM